MRSGPYHNEKWAEIRKHKWVALESQGFYITDSERLIENENVHLKKFNS